MPPKTIGLIAHTGKAGAASLICELAAEITSRGIELLVEDKTAAVAGLASDLPIEEIARRADLLVVLGGDGTILNVLSRLGDGVKPIFGINIGSLGFLTCVNSSSYQRAVECIVANEVTFSERTLLDVEVRSGEGNVTRIIGLNDAVISRGKLSRLIRLATRVNGEALTEFNADGLIIATPTGSTAYSLSAGGPILAPESGVFVITPICPHVLTNRSVIVNDRSTIEVEATQSDYPVYITVDGSEALRVEFGCKVIIRRARKTLSLAVLPEMTFFGVVRQKLKWTGSNL